MASPLTVTRNDYRATPKRSDIFTPPEVSRFLFQLLRGFRPRWILDPAIGKGSLTKRFRKTGSKIIGFDIVDRRKYADIFYQSRFEETEKWKYPKPDLILCNPPFNQGTGRKLYPEVFLRKFVELFGPEIPIVLFTPMGMRLNQREKVCDGNGFEIRSRYQV